MTQLLFTIGQIESKELRKSIRVLEIRKENLWQKLKLVHTILMAKKQITKLELTKEDISNYIYALDDAITDNMAYNFPMQFQFLNELKNKLTNLNK